MKTSRSFLRIILGITGILLGFSSKVLAQYGAPVHYYKVLGNIKSVDCPQPVQGLEVKVYTDGNETVQNIVTDSNGNFSLVLTNEDFYNNLVLKVRDKDGVANGGKFLDSEKEIPIRELKGYYYRLPDEKNVNHLFIQVKHDGKPPCKDEEIPVVEPGKNVAIEPVLPNEELEGQDEKEKIQPESENSPVNDTPLSSALLVYPNPNDGQCRLAFNLENPGKVELFVFSEDGKIVYQEKFEAEAGEVDKSISFSDIAPGNYHVRILSAGKSLTGTFIKL